MNKILLSIIALISLLATSCTRDFDEYNTDDKNPDSVTGESLFANAQKDLCDQMTSSDVNLNIFKLWAQQWTETTYPDESQYDIVTRNIPNNTFGAYYLDVLKDLAEADSIISADGQGTDEEANVYTNKLYIIDILEVYTYQRLVDIFGMVPYTEALDEDNLYPTYDKGQDIYEDLIDRINTDLAGLDESEDSFDSSDLYYSGDVSSWIKFANTLKIKLGITIADYDSDLAQTTIESAVDNCFESSDDDCLLEYQQASPNYNPIYESLVASGRHDFVPANTMVDLMNNLDDPRLSTYFTDAVEFPYQTDDDGNSMDTTLTEGNSKVLIYTAVDGSDSIVFKEAPFTLDPSDTKDADVKIYLGGEYGYSNSYSNYSHVADRILEATFTGFILTYTELQFYLAEAAARGYDVPNSASEYYEEGIRSSFEFWEADDVDSYLAQSDISYSSSDWREKIGTQAYIAAYTRGLEAYTTWRRLDYPIFNLAETIDDYSEIPVRFTFPVNEQTLNGTNVETAAEEIGGDELTTHIFWDIDQ